MEKKIKFKIGDWIVRDNIPMGNGVSRKELPMQIQKVKEHSYECCLENGDVVTLPIEGVDNNFSDNF